MFGILVGKHQSGLIGKNKNKIDFFFFSLILIQISFSKIKLDYLFRRCYYANTTAIIYVVDSSDKERISIAKDELHSMLNEDELKDAVLLVFANKQDLQGALNVAQVSETLELQKLKNRQWSIFKASAIQGKKKLFHQILLILTFISKVLV